MTRLVAALLAAIALAVAGGFAAASGSSGPQVHVQVLSLNDFHGHLDPLTGDDGEIEGEPAGGAAFLAAYLRRLRTARSVTVGAGDLTGASPLVSGLYDDRPTLAALRAMDVELSAVGNHEFDRGVPALTRQPFPWLAANVRRPGSETPLLPPYRIVVRDGIRIGFVGLTLRDTPSVVAPGGTDGVVFADEATTVNRYAAELKRRSDVDAVFVLLHEGGRQASEDPNGCDDLDGAVGPIVEAFSDDVDAVATGHTHDAYVCEIGGLPVAQAASFGRVVTDWDLSFDARTHTLTDVSARNVVVTHDVVPDPEVQALVERTHRRAAAVADRVVGTATAALSRRANDAGESPLGDVIADAQRAATGADLALMNPGNIRASVPAGDVTYAELYDAEPFGATLMVMTLTGAQLRTVLEQQFSRSPDAMLQVSAGFSYTYADGAITQMGLGGRPIADDQRLRIAANRFLAEGGDRFPGMRAGADVTPSVSDVEALEAWFAAGPVAPGPQDRITRG